MAFFLLILLTAIYFIRPYEWVPGLVGQPLYQWTILPCLVVSFNAWWSQLNVRSLCCYPISACALGLFVLVLISAVFNGAGVDFVLGYGKAILLYFLLVGIVDTRIRMSIFLQSLAVILFAMAALVVVNHHGIISIGVYSEMTAAGPVRLASQGANFDPNDTAALLVLGILISLHYMTASLPSIPIFLRPVWLGLALTQVYVLQLTDSRGGFLALIVGLASYTWIRWGKKGLLWGSFLLPIVLAKIATERMGTIGSSFSSDTGQSRIQFWCDGILLLKHNPFIGIGPNQIVTHIGRALHNTFIQAFAEIGFVGGVLFLGAFTYAFFVTYRLTRTRSVDAEYEPDRDPALPLICSLLAAYAMAILALNHLYGTHTYMLLGLATIIARLHGAENRIPMSTLFVRFAAVGASFVIISHITARLLVQW